MILILALGYLVFSNNSNNINQAFAAPLSQLSYQGRLTNNAGNPVSNGTYGILFSIYTQDNGGTAVWSETQNITTKNGIFSAILGASNAINLDFNSANKYYLGIKVGTDSEMSPRTQIGAAPLAINSKYLNGSQGGTGANNLLLLNSWGEIDIAGGIKTTGILQAGTSTLSSLTVSNNITLQAGILDMQDHTISSVDAISFFDAQGTIAGIQNQNLLDKTANETISGSWIFSNPITFSSLSLSSTSANPVLSVDNSTGINDIVRFLDNGTSVLTIANGGLATFAGNIDATSGLDVSGAALTVASQAITQTGGGQVIFAGNVDATGGLDVTSSNLTVGGANFSVAPGTGDITTAGDLTVNGDNITSDGALGIDGGTALNLTTTAGNINLNGAGTIELQDNTNATAGLDVTGADLTVGGAAIFNVAQATGNITTAGDLAVNGGDITSTAATFNLATSATTINIGSQATTTTITMGNNIQVLPATNGVTIASGVFKVLNGAILGGTEVFVVDGTAQTIKIGPSGATITRHLSATGTVGNGGAAIGAQTCIEDTIAVANAASGDTVVATPPSTIEASLVWSSYVSAAGTVTVRLCNFTAGGLASTDLTWRADVWQH